MHYEILIRFDESTGAYRGSHYISAAGQAAQPIPLVGLPAEVAAINAAALNAMGLQRVDIEGHAAAVEVLKSAHAEERRIASESSAAQIADLEKALCESRQTLAQHQAISDGLVNEASQAISTGDTAAMLDILHRASLSADDRARARIEAQMAALSAQLAAVTAVPEPVPAPVFSGALSAGTGTLNPATGVMTFGGGLTPVLPPPTLTL